MKNKTRVSFIERERVHDCYANNVVNVIFYAIIVVNVILIRYDRRM